MKKLLIIALLIVGCEDRRWDNVCTVRTITKCWGGSGCSSNETADKDYDEVSRDACMLMRDVTVFESGDCICKIETSSWMNEP